MPPPPAFFLALAGILGAYAVLAETVKRLFYKRYGIPCRAGFGTEKKDYLHNRTAKFMQDMVAVISLRFEDEISIDSLTEDLTRVSSTYPINLDQMIRNLHHLKRSGLISVDWHRRTIKREKPLEEYVRRMSFDNEMWSSVAEDWRRIHAIILCKRNEANPEYEQLLVPKPS